MQAGSSKHNDAAGEAGSTIDHAGDAVRAAARQAGKTLEQFGEEAERAAEETADSAKQAKKKAEKAVKDAAGVDDIPDFDLPTAVAMGVCSFEAYNEPGPMVGVAEGSETGTYKVFLDKDYLEERVKGILQVHLRWGTELPTRSIEETEDDSDDSAGGGDDDVSRGNDEEKDISPYLSVSVGPAAGVTRVAEKARHAQWRETFFLNIRDVEDDLVVKVFDQSDEKAIGPGDREVLARASVALAPMADGAVHDVTLDLGRGGKVDVSMQYTLLADTSFEEVQARSVSQMMTDDWSDGEDAEPESTQNDWFDTSRRLWRTSQKLFQADVPRMRLEEASRLADNVPPDRKEFKLWQGLLEDVVSRELTVRARPLAFVANPETDTELWVYRNPQQKDLIFAFRGTSSPKDMLTDMSVELKPFKPGQKVSEPSEEEITQELGTGSKLAPLVDKLRDLENWIGKLTVGKTRKLGLAKWVTSQAQMLYASEHDEVWVHKGFLMAYQSVAGSLLELAEEVMEGDEQWTVYATGHSMGGALATLFAYEVAQHDFRKAPKPEIQMWGFGSPRVGNIPFAEHYDELVFNTWRISNLNDIVTKVPSLLGFKHVGVEVRLLGGGDIAVKRGTFDDIREGAAFLDLIDRIKDGAFGKDKKLQKEFQAIVKAELDNAKALLKGDAVKDHMEDVYFEAVKACVDAGGDACVANLVAAEAVEEAAREEREGGGKEHSSKSKDDSEAKSRADAKRESSVEKAPEPENGGSGARTGKRPGTVGGGVGRGKGEGDWRHGAEDDSDGSDGAEDSDLDSLDDEFSDPSGSDDGSSTDDSTIDGSSEDGDGWDAPSSSAPESPGNSTQSAGSARLSDDAGASGTSAASGVTAPSGGAGGGGVPTSEGKQQSVSSSGGDRNTPSGGGQPQSGGSSNRQGRNKRGIIGQPY